MFWVLISKRTFIMRQIIEKRLIDLAIGINSVVNKMDDSLLSLNLQEQIVRSSSGAALNYGEAQGAESRKDFIHKSSIVLKELRETHINLKMIRKSQNFEGIEEMDKLIDECDQLIAIFHKTVRTAKIRSA